MACGQDVRRLRRRSGGRARGHKQGRTAGGRQSRGLGCGRRAGGRTRSQQQGGLASHPCANGAPHPATASQLPDRLWHAAKKAASLRNPDILRSGHPCRRQGYRLGPRASQADMASMPGPSWRAETRPGAGRRRRAGGSRAPLPWRSVRRPRQLAKGMWIAPMGARCARRPPATHWRSQLSFASSRAPGDRCKRHGQTARQYCGAGRWRRR